MVSGAFPCLSIFTKAKVPKHKNKVPKTNLKPGVIAVGQNICEVFSLKKEDFLFSYSF